MDFKEAKSRSIYTIKQHKINALNDGVSLINTEYWVIKTKEEIMKQP